LTVRHEPVRSRAGRLVGLVLLLALAAAASACAFPYGSTHPSADSLRKSAVSWIEAEPCQAVDAGDTGDYWIIVGAP